MVDSLQGILWKIVVLAICGFSNLCLGQITTSPSGGTIPATSGTQLTQSIDLNGGSGSYYVSILNFPSGWNMTLTPVDNHNDYRDGAIWRFTPPTGFSGEKPVTIRITDRASASNFSDVTFTIDVSGQPTPFSLQIEDLTVQEREIITRAVNLSGGQPPYQHVQTTGYFGSSSEVFYYDSAANTLRYNDGRYLNVSSDQTYQFQSTFRDQAGTTKTDSFTVTVTDRDAPATVPGAPTLTVPILEEAATTASFNWSTPSGSPTSYEIKLTSSRPSITKTVSGTSATIRPSDGLVRGVVYNVVVRAQNSAGFSPFSNTKTFEFNEDPTISALSPASGSRGQAGHLVTISGTQFTSGRSYSVTLGSTAEGILANNVPATRLSDTQLSFDLPTLPSGAALGSRTLFLRFGSRTVSRTGAYQVVDTPSAFDPPLIVSPGNGQNELALSPLLDWQAVSGANTYRVVLGTQAAVQSVYNSGGDGSGVSGITLVQTTSASRITVAPELQENTTYFWIVRAGEVGVRGGYYSPPRSFTTGQSSNAEIFSVTPLAGTLNQTATLTVTGSDLPDTLALFIPQFSEVSMVSHAIDRVVFTGIPRYEAGAKTGGVIKDRPGGETLHTFTFNVGAGAPEIFSTSPGTVSSGTTEIEFLIEGSGFVTGQTYEISLGDSISFGGQARGSATLVSPAQLRFSGATVAAGLESGLRDLTLYYPGGSIVIPSAVRIQGAGTPAAGKATAPIPATGSIDIAREIELAWTRPATAVASEVFLGTSPNALVGRGAQTANSLTVGPLAADTTWFWRVRTRNEEGLETEGDLWQFRTVAADPVLTIDHLETTVTGGSDLIVSWGISSGTVSEADITLSIRELNGNATPITDRTLSAEAVNRSREINFRSWELGSLIEGRRYQLVLTASANGSDVSRESEFLHGDNLLLNRLRSANVLSEITSVASPYLALSRHVYDPDKYLPPANFKPFHDRSSNLLSGFDAVAYRNETSGEVVIAYGGTKQLLDIKADIELTQNKLPQQFNDALAFLEEVRQKMAEEPLIAGKPILLTGHSLGGGMALYVGKKENLDFVVFNPALLNNRTYGEVPIQFRASQANGPRQLALRTVSDEWQPIGSLIEGRQNVVFLADVVSSLNRLTQDEIGNLLRSMVGSVNVHVTLMALQDAARGAKPLVFLSQFTFAFHSLVSASLENFISDLAPGANFQVLLDADIDAMFDGTDDAAELAQFLGSLFGIPFDEQNPLVLKNFQDNTVEFVNLAVDCEGLCHSLDLFNQQIEIWTTDVATRYGSPIEVADQFSALSPSTSVDTLNPIISWQWNGGETDQFEAFLGDQAEVITDPLVTYTGTASRWNPGLLNYDTHYYWNVRARQGGTILDQSDVRSFSTLRSPTDLIYPLNHGYFINPDTLRQESQPDGSTRAFLDIYSLSAASGFLTVRNAQDQVVEWRRLKGDPLGTNSVSVFVQLFSQNWRRARDFFYNGFSFKDIRLGTVFTRITDLTIPPGGRFEVSLSSDAAVALTMLEVVLDGIVPETAANGYVDPALLELLNEMTQSLENEAQNFAEILETKGEDAFRSVFEPKFTGLIETSANELINAAIVRFGSSATLAKEFTDATLRFLSNNERLQDIKRASKEDRLDGRQTGRGRLFDLSVPGTVRQLPFEDVGFDRFVDGVFYGPSPSPSLGGADASAPNEPSYSGDSESSTFNVGESIRFTANLANFGTIIATGRTLKARLLSEPGIDAPTRFDLGEIQAGPMFSGGRESFEGDFVIPDGVPAGQYHLAWELLSDGEDDLIEANNHYIFPTAISIGGASTTFSLSINGQTLTSGSAPQAGTSDFGPVALGSTQSQVITLSNSGDPISFPAGSIRLIDSTGLFTLVRYPTSGLGSGGTAEIEIAFTPDSTTSSEAILEIFGTQYRFGGTGHAAIGSEINVEQAVTFLGENHTTVTATICDTEDNVFVAGDYFQELAINGIQERYESTAWRPVGFVTRLDENGDSAWTIAMKESGLSNFSEYSCGVSHLVDTGGSELIAVAFASTSGSGSNLTIQLGNLNVSSNGWRSIRFLLGIDRDTGTVRLLGRIQTNAGFSSSAADWKDGVLWVGGYVYELNGVQPSVNVNDTTTGFGNIPGVVTGRDNAWLTTFQLQGANLVSRTRIAFSGTSSEKYQVRGIDDNGTSVALALREGGLRTYAHSGGSLGALQISRDDAGEEVMQAFFDPSEADTVVTRIGSTLRKLDSSGATDWETAIPILPSYLTPTTEGWVIAGLFQDSISLPTNFGTRDLSSTGGRDAAVVWFDADGHLDDAVKIAGGNYDESVRSIESCGNDLLLSVVSQSDPIEVLGLEESVTNLSPGQNDSIVMRIHREAGPTLLLDKINLQLSSTASTEHVEVFTEGAWSISETADWLTVSPANGTGNGTLTLQVQANPAAVPRFADVDVSGVPLMVQQDAFSGSITLSGTANFEEVPVGDTSTGSLLIANSGQNTIEIFSVQFPSSFSGTDWSGLLATGEQISIPVRFTPSATGPYLGEIEVQSNATSGSSSLSVSGTGVALPALLSVSINNGASETASSAVFLNHDRSGPTPTEYRASESAGFIGAQWSSYSAPPSFTLSAGNGEKTIHLQLRNDNGESNVISDTITLSIPNLPVLSLLQINDGSSLTTSRTVSLQHVRSAGAASDYRASEIPDFRDAEWLPLSGTPTFILSDGDGVKTVFFQLRNEDGASDVRSDTVTLEELGPPVLTSIILENGLPTTVDRTVDVEMIARKAPTEMLLSEDPGFAGASWVPWAASTTFSVSPIQGDKTIYARLRNEWGLSEIHSAMISYDVPVTPVPYAEGFETGLGVWTPPTGTDFFWLRHSGPTPTADTGPDSAAVSEWYAFAEASGENAPARITTVEASFDLSGVETPALTFSYSMHGDQMGSLSVDVLDNGTWTLDVFRKAGEQHESPSGAWSTAFIPLVEFAGKTDFTIRFRGITGTGERSDIAIDAVTIDQLPRFSPVEPLTQSPDRPSAVRMADLDGDGDQDVVVAESQGDRIDWFENDGSGEFKMRHQIAGSIDGPQEIVVEDFDNDGDLDVAATAQSGGEFYWFENRENGTEFAPHPVGAGTPGGTYSIETGDFNGDGAMDLVISARLDDKISWYRNDGSGEFSIAKTLATPDEPGRLSADDFDGDGDIDLFAAIIGEDEIHLYANDGTGEFGSATVVLEDVNQPSAIRLADLDNDSDLDLLFAAVSAGNPPNVQPTVGWLENDGAGGFGDREEIRSTPYPISNVIAFDVDGDRDLDVISTSQEAGTVSANYNDDTSFNMSERMLVLNNAWDIDVGDLDGDDDLDLAVVGLSSDIVGVSRNLAANGGVIGDLRAEGDFSNWDVSIGDPEVRFLRLVNRGSRPVEVSNITAPNSLEVDWIPGSVLPGRTRFVPVRFSPVTESNVAGSIGIVSDADDTVLPLDVNANAYDVQSFADWFSANAINDPDAHPDDGVAYLLRFASNLSANEPIRYLSAESPDAGLPTIRLVADGASWMLRIDYLQKRLRRNELVYTVETSGDLMNWSSLETVDIAKTITPINWEWEKVTVLIDADGDQLYVRIAVTVQ